MLNIERDEDGKIIRPTEIIPKSHARRSEFRDDGLEPKVGESWVANISSVSYSKSGANVLMVDRYGDKYLFHDLDFHPLDRFLIRLRRHNFELIMRITDQ
jgi:hypothetical protein